MGSMDSNSKKLYDAVATLILNLHMQKGGLNEEEMYCLLSILDLTLMGKNDRGLIGLLREWKANEPNPEIDDIIKATLLSMDFANLDSDSQQKNIETIHDLLRYNKELRER